MEAELLAEGDEEEGEATSLNLLMKGELASVLFVDCFKSLSKPKVQ